MQIKSRVRPNQKRETGVYAKQQWRQMQTKLEPSCGAERIQTVSSRNEGVLAVFVKFLKEGK